MSGIQVETSPGRPPAVEDAIEVDAAVALPVAFSGLRRILQRLREDAPGAISAAAASRPAEWNRLFPGELAGAPDLSDLAVTPSERRLHRESEQTFRILNLGARAVLDALRATGRTLVVRNAGQSDLVSLRGLMRAAEWSRLDGTTGRLVLAEWSARPARVAARFIGRRDVYLDTLAERMRARKLDGAGAGTHLPSGEPLLDLEGSYLGGTFDAQQPLERRIASALLAIRACFFTTNHEGALLAAEEGLRLLAEAGGKLDPAAVVSAWDSLDHPDFDTPVIELDRTSLGDSAELQALFYRQIGVVHAFTGEFTQAIEDFGAGLELAIAPERKAQLRMFRALTLIKRMGNQEKARGELEAGYQAMASREGYDARLQEGWLRNVHALTYFMDKKLGAAMEQEKIAIRCMHGLNDPSAAHLMTNLISNVSVLQESAKEHAAALVSWRNFESVSVAWGPSFDKHFVYRRAGLELKAGDRASAARDFAATVEKARVLGDAYHEQAVSGELARLHLDDGHTAEAAQWYERSAEAARVIGDPFRVAESLAGLSVARGNTDFAEAHRLALESTTYPTEVKRLADALASGRSDDVRAALPTPRTKLNRPFDLVNLY